ncbi:radical SAM protein [Streptomyces sp. CA-253872]|uniref:radical SAM protein n=1 Tax=Streptomyces sp. CA-253872 TaxID=3240067 RepID=UPI003D8DEAA9
MRRRRPGRPGWRVRRAYGAALRNAFPGLGGELLEATIECSPETLEREKLAAFRAIGFRRLSSAVRSFDDKRLRTLGRSHDARQARVIVREAEDAGFEDSGVDLIRGFPGQPSAETREAVRIALDPPPDARRAPPLPARARRRDAPPVGAWQPPPRPRRAERGYAEGAELLTGAGAASTR